MKREEVIKQKLISTRTVINRLLHPPLPIFSEVIVFMSKNLCSHPQFPMKITDDEQLAERGRERKQHLSPSHMM